MRETSRPSNPCAASDASGVVVRETPCRTVLNESSLSDYSLNCYTGCTHACVYCYARFMGRFQHPGESWGRFVDVKINAPEALARQLRKRWLLPPGSVFVSSVCDAYQPLEAQCRLTRQCLGPLLEAGYRVHVQTKSPLVQRDYDLLAGRDNASVCLTITTVDAALARLLEPQAPAPDERLAALREARRAGITAKAFVGPLMPGLTDTPEALEALLAALAELDLAEVYLDRLNLRWGVWPALKQALAGHGEALRATGQMLFNDAARGAYNCQLRQRALDAAAAARLKAPLNIIF